MTRSDAAVGTLVIRFGTLWFGVIVGLVALALISRRLGRSVVDESVSSPESLAPP